MFESINYLIENWLFNDSTITIYDSIAVRWLVKDLFICYSYLFIVLRTVLFLIPVRYVPPKNFAKMKLQQDGKELKVLTAQYSIFLGLTINYYLIFDLHHIFNWT